MSVNITVSGKFNRHCGKHSILDDPERVKKEQEEERRKVRLQQVREESKHLAQQIRKDVAEEKERQLRNLDAIRAQELDCWRQHVLTHKTNDYRTAIFQVGMAHCAARRENEAKAANKKRQPKPASYKDFRRQMKARQSCKDEENQQDKANVQAPEKLSKTCCTQTSPVGQAARQDTIRRLQFPTCKHDKYCCCCSSSDTNSFECKQKSEDDEEQSCSSTDTEDTSSSSVAAPRKRDGSKRILLRQTPAVVVDVELDSNDSLTITAPYEIKDNHVRNNRQFSRVIRQTPTKANEEERTDPKATTSSKNEPSTAAAETARELKADKPRFTQISELVRKDKARSEMPKVVAISKNSTVATNPATSKSQDIPKATAASKKAEIVKKPEIPKPRPKSPVKGLKSSVAVPKVPPSSPKSLTPVKPSLKTTYAGSSSTSKSTKTTGPTPNTATSATITICDGDSAVGDPEVSGRVQFYDYNNKFTKNYSKPPNAVQARDKNPGQLNAMEEAEVEKHLRESREREIEQLRKKSNERGQKAMEREQVRRDCQELTEKLDTLTRQYPQIIPNDVDLQPRHRYVDRAARKETAMNSAVEKLLVQPTVITCPEVRAGPPNYDKARPDISRQNIDHGLNLGQPTNGPSKSMNSSDSCCSLLLEYVNDQSKQVQLDLNASANNPMRNQQKTERLKDLLQRIEELRSALLLELQTDKKSTSSDRNSAEMQNVIDSIVDLRKEREHILSENTGNVPQNVRNLQQTENLRDQGLKNIAKDLPQKENVNNLQQKENVSRKTVANEIVTRNEGENSAKTKSVKAVQERSVVASIEKPVEIIIQLKGDKCVRSMKQKTQRYKSPRKASTLIATKPLLRKHVKRNTAVNSPKQQKSRPVVQQTSYDSGSTSYRSLPPALTNNMDALAQQIAAEFQQQSEANHVEKTPVQEATGQLTARLNPLLAHYVQRLLGMSRDSIRALGISSSDIQTPSSSIVNYSGNMTSSTITEGPTGLSEDRITSVERFIVQNRSFVNDLKKVICAQDDIWRQRLLAENRKKQDRQAREKAKNRTENITEKEAFNAANSRELQSKPAVTRSSVQEQAGELHGSKSPTDPTEMGKADSVHKKSDQRRGSKSPHISPIDSAAMGKADSVHQKADQRRGSKSPHISPTGSVQTGETSAVQITSNIRISKSIVRSQQQQQSTADDKRKDETIERYEQLTSNCTQRIAELTDLISRVREEKQQLLEVTLSSASEPGRNSTEYMELPPQTGKPQGDDSTNQQSHNKLLDSNLIQEILNSSPDEGPPPAAEYITSSLEKHKHTGKSRDSGISMSRPMTAQEQRAEDVWDPCSCSSTSHADCPSTLQQSRKVRPPATLRRFSPQQIEDELAHELSTILEVDTPGGTARANASAKEAAFLADKTGGGAHAVPQAPLSFPTFEQYMQQINLDITQIDPEQSIRIEQEYNELVAALKEAGNNKDLNYMEFPSLTTYLQNIASSEGHHLSLSKETSQDSIEDLLACLRLANLTVKSFPNRTEYLKRLANNTPEEDEADTESLANLNEYSALTDTETESTMNIEAELRRRNIRPLPHESDRSGANRIVSSTVIGRSGDQSRMFAQFLNAESGIEKISSTSPESPTGAFERDMMGLGMHWPSTMRRRGAEGENLSSSTSSPSKPVRNVGWNEQQQDKSHRAYQCSDRRAMGGRPLSLRDFLTKELLKHASTSCSSSAPTDDSLRSQFLQSVIDSISPGCTPSTNGVGGTTTTAGAGGRQKTSTPVNSRVSPTSDSHRTQHSSTSSTAAHLFSGESGLSSVRHQQERRSPPPQPQQHAKRRSDADYSVQKQYERRD